MPSNPPSTESGSPTWPSRPYKPRSATWPYTASDFERMDDDSDSQFYSAPRIVTHIDDHAIDTLGEYYKKALPRKGRILDFCTSHLSHFPDELAEEVDKGNVKVVGVGMNEYELSRNPVLNDGHIVQDLNNDPDVSKLADGAPFDAATCVVSIDYLTQPREVLTSLRSAMKEGGEIHLAISNRCFPTKVIKRWLKLEDEERPEMAADYLHFSGWKDVEIIELAGNEDEGGSLWAPWPSRRYDPLWIVKGVKRST